jgi:hypothetical protein
VVAGATVVIVPVREGANALAPGLTGPAPRVKAHPIPVAIRLGIGTHVPARAAVVGIPAQVSARPVAVDGPRRAAVDALAVGAGGLFVGDSTRPAVVETGAAVADVGVEVGAVIAATGFRIVAAIEAAAGSTDSTAGLHARLTGREACLPLPLGALIAEGPAGVRPSGPGGPQSQRTEHRAGQGGAKQTKCIAARNGFVSQRFRELIDVMGHGGHLSSQVQDRAKREEG